MINEDLDEKYSFKVHSAYIAEVKRSLGLTIYDAPNAVETLKNPGNRDFRLNLNPLVNVTSGFLV